MKTLRFNPRKVSKELPELFFADLFPGQELVSVYPTSLGNGGSEVLDYTLLNMFAKNIKDCSYLEIGIWRAEGILNVSRFAAS